MIVYQIIAQKVPFNCAPVNLMMLIAMGKRPEFDEDTPLVYKELIKRCWDQLPNDRPAFKESDIDPFVSSFSIDEVIFCLYVDGHNMNVFCNTIAPTYKDFKKKTKKSFF